MHVKKCSSLLQSLTTVISEASLHTIMPSALALQSGQLHALQVSHHVSVTAY